MSTGKKADAEPSAIAEMALKLAETQMLAQIADDASLDGRATGLLAFNGAIVAATIAAKSLLGGNWWTPLIVVTLTTWMLLFKVLYPPVELERQQLQREQEEQQRRWEEQRGEGEAEYEEEEEDDDDDQEEQDAPPRAIKKIWRTLVRTPTAPDVALPAREFYERYGRSPSRRARVRLVSHLGNAFAVNGYRIAYRRRWLRTATLTLVAGFGIAAFLIVVDLPSKMRTCPKSPSRCRSHPSRGHTSTPPEGRSGKADELVALALTIEAGHRGALVEIAESIEGG